jgi:hypothetical protein
MIMTERVTGRKIQEWVSAGVRLILILRALLSLNLSDSLFRDLSVQHRTTEEGAQSLLVENIRKSYLKVKEQIKSK